MMNVQHRARVSVWLSANGYKSNPLRRATPHGHPISDLLEHGFQAYHVETGRLVLFGDPYPDTRMDQVPHIAERYGLTVRRYPGLWNPGQSVLLEFWIDNPSKAWRLFANDTQVPRSFRGLPPVIVGQPARYLGTTLARASAGAEN